jgi:hypothetical protein
VRRPKLIPELQAIGGDLVVVDEDGALDKIGQQSDCSALLQSFFEPFARRPR